MPFYFIFALLCSSSVYTAQKFQEIDSYESFYQEKSSVKKEIADFFNLCLDPRTQRNFVDSIDKFKSLHLEVSSMPYVGACFVKLLSNLYDTKGINLKSVIIKRDQDCEYVRDLIKYIVHNHAHHFEKNQLRGAFLKLLNFSSFTRSNLKQNEEYTNLDLFENLHFLQGKLFSLVDWDKNELKAIKSVSTPGSFLRTRILRGDIGLSPEENILRREGLIDALRSPEVDEEFVDLLNSCCYQDDDLKQRVFMLLLTDYFDNIVESPRVEEQISILTQIPEGIEEQLDSFSKNRFWNFFISIVKNTPKTENNVLLLGAMMRRFVKTIPVKYWENLSCCDISESFSTLDEIMKFVEDSYLDYPARLKILEYATKNNNFYIRHVMTFLQSPLNCSLDVNSLSNIKFIAKENPDHKDFEKLKDCLLNTFLKYNDKYSPLVDDDQERLYKTLNVIRDFAVVLDIDMPEVEKPVVFDLTQEGVMSFFDINNEFDRYLVKKIEHSRVIQDPTKFMIKKLSLTNLSKSDKTKIEKQINRAKEENDIVLGGMSIIGRMQLICTFIDSTNIGEEENFWDFYFIHAFESSARSNGSSESCALGFRDHITTGLFLASNNVKPILRQEVPQLFEQIGNALKGLENTFSFADSLRLICLADKKRTKGLNSVEEKKLNNLRAKYGIKSLSESLNGFIKESVTFQEMFNFHNKPNRERTDRIDIFTDLFEAFKEDLQNLEKPLDRTSTYEEILKEAKNIIKVYVDNLDYRDDPDDVDELDEYIETL